jgi:hypothetical protein
MKRAFPILLCLTLIFAPIGAALAVNSDMSFEYALTANGGASATVAPGDVFAVSLTLSRADVTQGYPMYAVQGNIRYDSGFFELVPGSMESAGGVRADTVELGGSWDGWTGVSASAYSTRPEGEAWQNTVVMVTFRLKALRVGASTIFSEDCVVSTADGLDGYSVTSNNATVTVKSGGGNGKPTEFDDVPAGAWYEEAVSFAAREGLFTGISENLFAPNGAMTRAMLVTILYRNEGKTTPYTVGGGVPDATPFTDVPTNQWYTDAVKWAAANGIVNGVGGNKFAPDAPVTREQFATILYNYAKFVGVDAHIDPPSDGANLTGYTDASQISDWASEAMRWAVGAGLITGRTTTTLAPQGSATRAEAAVLLMRYIESAG